MSNELKNELEHITDIFRIRLIVAKQLIKSGYTYESFTEEAKKAGLSQITLVGLQNAMQDITNGFVKKDKILDIKLNNL